MTFKEAWEDLWEIPGILTFIFWGLWFGLGILVGVAICG